MGSQALGIALDVSCGSVLFYDRFHAAVLWTLMHRSNRLEGRSPPLHQLTAVGARSKLRHVLTVCERMPGEIFVETRSRTVGGYDFWKSQMVQLVLATLGFAVAKVVASMLCISSKRSQRLGVRAGVKVVSLR